ncbi:MAG: MMPL family transporter [Lachnospiraceae bacterium]|nr:MMPL family transporter [Lachnospiraceae bacterium]
MSKIDKPVTEEKDGGFMVKVATFIVEKRNLFFLLFGLGIIFSLIASNWVSVENALSAYLPETSETHIGLDLMEDEYVTYGSADIMVQNVTYEKAEELVDYISSIDYVAMVQFDNTTDHYNDFSALLSVTFIYEETDDECLNCLSDLTERLKDYDIYVSTTLGDQSSETIATEMQSITVYVAIIVLVVLLFTSDSYAEIPVLVITFLTSAALSSGTNFLLGTISFVSDSVTIVLQLALSVDYAVIFLNKYKNELKIAPPKEADIMALSKAIPEITASSLTTIGGLIAMSFMQFGIGPDMAIVLIKAIILSLLSVFLLMPGLIMIFSGLMEKTRHKSFVPKIPFVGKFAYKTRFIIPIIFLGLIIVGYYYSSKCPYVYGYSTLETAKKSEQDIINELIDDTFSSPTMVAINVPAGDYDKEAKLLSYLESREEIQYTTGLANTEAMNGRMLTEKLNAREFSEMIGIDSEVAELLYSAYAIDDENYGKLVNGIDKYSVPFIDMFTFLHKEIENEIIVLDDETAETVEEAYNKIDIARNQLQGENYDRMLLYMTLPEEGEETFAFLDELHTIAQDYYGEDANIVVVGEPTSQYDLKKTFDRDNTVVNVVSMLAVLVVLLFTFKSAGMPVLLILIIEGCIWVNFSFPYITHTNLFFMGYLIVSSIQMGANIDYAIVVSSRYQEVKKTMSQRDAIIDTMNYAFPTIVTSGTMLAMAGILIGQMTSEPCIAGIGVCLGRGTIISIIVVMFALPQILLFGDKLIEKTSFDVNVQLPTTFEKNVGVTRLDGFVRGHINGEVVGFVRGTVIGDVDLRVNNIGGENEEDPKLIENKEGDESHE